VGAYKDDRSLVELGSVTIPPNHEIPDIQAIVEVQYLYAYKDGSIYQPVYKGPRRDQVLEACVTSQLKYKSDGPATAAPKKASPKL
jgi:bifunctional non-homologous end joining protein LigD